MMAERGALLAAHAISVAAAYDMNDIRAAAQRYAEALAQDEWPRMANQEGSATAGQALLRDR
jgi:hypothetical protein